MKLHVCHDIDRSSGSEYCGSGTIQATDFVLIGRKQVVQGGGRARPPPTTVGTSLNGHSLFIIIFVNSETLSSISDYIASINQYKPDCAETESFEDTLILLLLVCILLSDFVNDICTSLSLYMCQYINIQCTM